MAWFALVILGLVWLGWQSVRRKPKTTVMSGTAVVVDGSNVMFWGGDPSEKVLRTVIASLKSRGFLPYVIFDANAGYRLRDRYLDAGQMAKICQIPVTSVEVVDRGVVADGVILARAKAKGVKVVSNDRYRDWSVKYPLVKRRGRMMRGTWKSGTVVWR